MVQVTYKSTPQTMRHHHRATTGTAGPYFFVAVFLRVSANVTVSFPWPLEAWNAAIHDSVASSFLHEQDLHDLALAIWFQSAFYTPRNDRVSATLFEFQCIRSNPEYSQSSRASLF